jgi:teichuronic acid biosynthesis glycosyltransferase TuaC
VYLEAMSAGRPAIGCLGQGIDEVIEPGVNGCLIKPDDLQQLTDTLTSLLHQPEARREMGAAARRSILQSYTLGEQAARLYRLYQECRR